MSSPRIRRLNQDHQRLKNRFASWELIRLTGTAGLPPEHYRIAYSIRGLYVDATGQILERNEHVMEIDLSLGYPRRAPQCRMLTPVFHPNFDEASVCTGDFWAASERLDDLIVRIGRMIAYQEYNMKSPLNGLAARWAAEHPQFLPLDPREIAPPLLEQSEIDSCAGAEAATPVDRPENPSADPWTGKIVVSNQ
jgi:ubiquitin-protein ligase